MAGVQGYAITDGDCAEFRQAAMDAWPPWLHFVTKNPLITNKPQNSGATSHKALARPLGVDDGGGPSEGCA